MNFSNKKIEILGYVLVNGKYYDEKSDLSDLVEILINNEFLVKCKLSGCFLIKFTYEDSYYFITDSIRTYPFFYSWNEIEKKWIFTKNIDHFKKNKVNTELLKRDFKYTGYCTGADTLIKDVFQAESGTLYKFSIYGKLKSIRYLNFRYSNEKYDISIENLHQIHVDIFKSVLDFCKSKQLVVPLSGGLDSRLVVNMLRHLGAKNVITYTYGKKDNKESLISKVVAESLGFKWYFIEYKKYKWINFHKDKKFFFEKFFDYCSIPHIQDYLAVKELQDKGVLQENAIFIPGHSADFLQGTHIPAEIFYDGKTEFSSDKLFSIIAKSHYIHSINKIKKKEYVKEYLNLQKNILSKSELIENFESWNYKERQTKFISNSVNIYRKLGYDAILPLWDSRLIEFWINVPLNRRFQRKHYLEYSNKYDEFIALNKKKSNLKDVIKLTRYIDFIKRNYNYLLNLINIKYHPLGFYEQYKKFRVIKGVFMAKNINSFIVEDILEYLDT